MHAAWVKVGMPELREHKSPYIQGRSCFNGGESGIRTHGRLTPTAVFKTAALNHSAISPIRNMVAVKGRIVAG